MIICVCHRVSHHDIHRAVREGCVSFEDLQQELRVATCCGCCRSCAVDTFEAAQGAQGAQCSPVPPQALTQPSLNHAVAA